MKRAALIGIVALLVTLVLLLLAADPAAAQTGAICLFADPTGSDCTLSDHSPGTLSIYVVHTLTPGAMGSQFSAPKPDCMVGASWLVDVKPFPVTLGDSQSGVSIGYGTCQPSPIHILTIMYATSGTTELDCFYRVRPHPAVGRAEMVDCNDNLLEVGLGNVFLNSDRGCVCSESPLPGLIVFPSTLDFGIDPDPRTFQILNGGGSPVQWTISDDREWLAESPLSGTDDAIIKVAANRYLLGPGENEGHVFVESNGDTETVSVYALNNALLSVSPTSLDFGTMEQLGFFRVENAGTCCLSWSATTSSSWVTEILPSSGTSDALVRVTISRAGLANGTHTGVIAVNSTAGNSAVTMSMSVQPTLAVTPTHLDYGTDKLDQTITIANTGTGTLVWNATPSYPWLLVSPSSGTGGSKPTISVNRANLSNGNYDGNVVISSNGGEIPVSVSMIVQPKLAVYPVALYFSGSVVSQTFDISNIRVGTLEWRVIPNASWITIVPDEGTGNATVTVTVDPEAAGGPTQSSVTIASNGGEKGVNVQIGPPPVLSISPTYLKFKGLTGSNSFWIQNIGPGFLRWTASCDTSWIQCSPTSGTGNAIVTVSASRCDIPLGTWAYSAISVASDGGNGTVSIAAEAMPRLAATPSPLDFYGAAYFLQQTLHVVTPCTEAIDWTIEVTPPAGDLLIVGPPSGSGHADVSVTFMEMLLPPSSDEWHGSLVLSSPQVADPIVVPVSWHLEGPFIGTESKSWGNLKSSFAEPPKK